MTPETQNIEWKRSWRDEYLAWICGFANAHGGMIEIGKNDRGEVVGLRNVLSLLEEIPSKVQSLLGIVVDVNLKSDDRGLEYIEIVVKPHTNPISYRGRFHYRSGSTKQVLEGPALTRLLLERHGRTWDDVPLPGVSLRSLDSRAFDEFRRRGSESQRLPQSIMDESDESVIEKLCLREAGFLKRAAVLLFHPEPHRFIAEAYVKIGYLRGSEVLFQDVIQGDLFTQVDRALDLLYTKYTRALISYDDIYRVETFPVPRDAMREAAINALIHRDYLTPTSIQIRVRDDRISIWNAAHLAPDWGAERLTREPASQPRNPHLAYSFFRAGMIEAWGRGIRRIHEECRKAGNPAPVWKLEPGGNGLRLRFPFSEAYLTADAAARGIGGQDTTRITTSSGSARNRPEDHQKTARATGKTTSMTTSNTTGKTSRDDTRSRILSMLREQPAITQPDIAARLGVTLDGVRYHFRKLQSEGVIRRAGSRKSGHWEVLSEARVIAREKTAGKTASNTTGKTSRDDTRSRILSMLREQPAITQPDIATRLGVTLDGVRYHFRKLQSEGVIRRAGSRKSGYWEVLGDEEPKP